MRLIPLFFIAFAALLAQPTLPGPVTVRPPVDDSSAASIRLREKLANGTDYFEWKAPAALVANVTLIGPDALPASPQCLLVDTAGATSYVACSGTTSAMIFASDYDFAAQTPGGSLTAATPASITLTPCPAGVSHDNTDHKLRVFGGTGTAEAVLITGGDCESGAATGTIEFTPANNHSGAWQVGSATAGGQEAVYIAVPLGTVFFKGSNTLYATITVRTTATKTHHVSIRGVDRASSIIVADSTLSGPGVFIADFNNAAEKWTSAQYGVSDLSFDFNAAPDSDIIQVGDGTDIDVGNGPLISRLNMRGGKRSIYGLSTGKLWVSDVHINALTAAYDGIYLDVTANPLAMGGWTLNDIEVGTNEAGGAGAGSGIHIVCNHLTSCNWTNLDMVEILGKWKHSVLVENTAATAPAVGAGMYVTIDHLVTEAFTVDHTVRFLNASFSQIRNSWISNMTAAGNKSGLSIENGYEFVVNGNYFYSATGGADVNLVGGARHLFSANRFIGTTKAFAFDAATDTTASTVGFNHFAQIPHNQNAKWIAFVTPVGLNTQPLISPFRVLFKDGTMNLITLENGDTGTATPKKPIYVDSGGVFRMTNNGYSANILSVDDAGYGAFGTLAFASLGTVGNAFQIYCSDCKLTSAVNNTCATGGTGALAVRINSVWRCFDTPNVGGGGWTTLTFADTETEKLRFFATSPTAHYGISVAAADLRIYRASHTDHISFGYGTAAAFTAEMWMDENEFNLGAHNINATAAVVFANHASPSSGNTYDLGFAAGPIRWRNLYVTNIDASGKVGIGTASASEALVVGIDLGNLAANTAIVISDPAADSAFYIGQGASALMGAKWIYNATPASAYASFVTSGYGHQIRFDGSVIALQSGSGGNVGIGVTVAPARLTISDAAEEEKIRFFTTSGSAHYGISVAAANLRIYRASHTDHISFGYGTAAAFTAEMWMDENEFNLGAHNINATAAVVFANHASPSSGNTYDLGFAAGPIRWRKLYITDIDASGTITGNVTGALTGNADTATALSTNPSACDPGEFVTDIAANGTLTCATTSGLSVTVTCGAGTAVKNITFVNGLATGAGCGVP